MSRYAKCNVSVNQVAEEDGSVSFLVFVYTMVALVLALYGMNALWLAIVHMLTRPHDPEQPPAPVDWPRVTVQIPIYNEVHVASRVIQAVSALDYPADRLEIQVLDDSDDETSGVVARLVQRLQAQGVRIYHLRRENRAGYKAGALAYGLARARGEYIAIFDADFVPPRDWLRRTVPHLMANPRLGFVQTRWEHLNALASSITLAQSLALDGHFGVEQPARSRVGWPVVFNGSAGLWRRSCIEGSGGWQADTLCEDLDLSYRAAMQGWKGLVLTRVTAAGEIPPSVEAFRRQQARWATGSIQTLRKHTRAWFHAPLPWSARLQGFIHMSNYLVHPFMLLLFLLTLPMLFIREGSLWPLTYLSFAGLGPPLVYAWAQWSLRGHGRRLRALPLLVFLGLGIAWTGSKAVWQGLRGRSTPFVRTPKFHLVGRDNRWWGKQYDREYGDIPLGELLFAGYALFTFGVAVYLRNWWAVPFLFVYAAGFITVGGRILWERGGKRSRGVRVLPNPPVLRPSPGQRE